MHQYLAEFLGTTLLLLLGNGVVANVVLDKTKGHDAGWIVISAGWGLAVFTAVICVGDISGAHINPAVSIGLAAAGQFDWGLVPGYVVAQMLGGITGGALVFVFYKSHYGVTKDADAKLATFCTAPNIRAWPLNLFCEVAATFVLVYAVLQLVDSDPTVTLAGEGGGREIQVGLGSIGAMRVALIVTAIGLSLGGTTGYAINPARDLGPRIAHAVLPVPGKRDSDWSYALIPVLGPVIGGLAAAALFVSLPS